MSTSIIAARGCGHTSRNYETMTSEATPSRRRASLAPSAPVSAAQDRLDRATAQVTGMPSGSCRPMTVRPSKAHPDGPASVADAVSDAISSRRIRTYAILDAVRRHLIRQDGPLVGGLLADGFSAWVTPAGFFLLTGSEEDNIRASRTLAAYVPAPIPSAYTANGKLSPGVVALPDGGGLILGSSRVAGGCKVTRWGRTDAVMGDGPGVGKRVALSLRAWVTWLRWCYNHTEAANHADVVAQYAPADKVLRYTTGGRKASGKPTPVDDTTSRGAAVAAAVAGLSAAEVAALPASLRAALGL